MPIRYTNIKSPKISHKITYVITLFEDSKHIGGAIHQAKYSCGLWFTLDHRLICLHRDVKSYTPKTSDPDAAENSLKLLGKFPDPRED